MSRLNFRIMNTLKNFVLLVVICVSGYIIYRLADVYSPGTFPNAENYDFELSEPELIKIINRFKENNKKYMPPSNYDLIDGRQNPKDQWYRLYFYYPETNEIIYAWTRVNTKNSTTIGFVRVNRGSQLGNWKDINRDFDYNENKKQKEKFNNVILNPIREMISQKKK